MLDTILAYANDEDGIIDADSQSILYDVFRQRGDYSRLAWMCQLDNLDPKVDDQLGTLNQAPVRAAWVSRAGRSADEVSKKLKSERRVGVIADVMAGELPEGLHAELLGRTESATVAIAAMQSEAAPRAVREAASRKMATDLSSLNWGQRAAVSELWSHEEFLAVAALEAVRRMEDAIKMIGPVKKLTAAAQSRIVTLTKHSVLSARKAMADATAASWMVTRPVQDTLNSLTALVAADWCPDEIVSLGHELAQEALTSSQVRHASSYAAEARRLQAMVEKRRDGTATSTVALAGKAQDCDDTTLPEVLEALATLPREWRLSVYRALLSNEKLSLRGVLKVAAQSGYELRSALGDDDRNSIPLSARAALVLAGWESPTLETADLVIAHLNEASGSRALVVLHGLLELDLADEQLWTLPASSLSQALATDTHVSRRVGKLLLRELAGCPAGAWHQFEELSRNFPGTLRSLLDVCQASHA